MQGPGLGRRAGESVLGKVLRAAVAVRVAVAGSIVSVGSISAQEAPLQAKMYPEDGVVKQGNMIYISAVDLCKDSDGHYAGDVDVTFIHDEVAIKPDVDIDSIGFWDVDHRLDWEAPVGDYTVEITCTPKGQTSPVQHYAPLIFTVRELPKDYVATVSPETMKPGAQITVESVDSCPLPIENLDSASINVSYLGVDGSGEPQYIDVFTPVRMSSEDGSWSSTFSAPELEGVYALRMACVKNYIPGNDIGFKSAYTPLMFVVDAEGGEGPISPPSEPPEIPPMPPEALEPDPASPPPAPAVPGTPNFTG